jgi:hypothetical protein
VSGTASACRCAGHAGMMSGRPGQARSGQVRPGQVRPGQLSLSLMMRRASSIG